MTRTATPTRPLLAAILFVVVAAACSSGSDSTPAAGTAPPATSDTSASTASTVAPTTTIDTDSTDDSTDGVIGGATDEALPADPVCQVLERQELGRVGRAELIEASGLAASRRHDGILWAVNDSGQQAGLFAFDSAGGDLGFFALTSGGSTVDGVDIEDLAIVDETLYIADIGDNGRRRASVMIHVVDEPQPGADGTVEVIRTIEVRYPDGATDAEALLVDPAGDELLILSKDLDEPLAPTRLYTVPLSTELDGQVVDAEPAGSIDVAALTNSSDGFSINTLLFPGSITAADLDPGHGVILLRTYGSVWLYTRDPGQSLAEALTSSMPCEVGSASEQQGESIALLPDPPGEPDQAQGAGLVVRYITVSEGANPPVNRSVAEVAG